jgi:hypothetical protein
MKRKTTPAQGRRVHESGMGTLEVFPLNTAEDFLFRLFKDLFENYWDKVQFGILIQGSVLEISPPAKPTKVALFDGYLTVEFDRWHMHVCLGESTGRGCEPTPAAVTAHRRPSRAELYRKLNKAGKPTFWALRLFNGKNEQLLTVFLPNPLLTDDMNYASTPDWSKLQIWDYLRKTYLNLNPDPKDRTAARFTHD